MKATHPETHARRAHFTSQVRALTDPVKDSTRQRLATEAMTLFSRKGYGGTSMREIAATVGMQAASIYGHFPLGKRQVLMDGLLDILDDFLVCVVAPVATDQGPREELVDVVTRHVRWRLERGDMSLAWDAAYFGLGMTDVLEDAQMAELTAAVESYRSYLVSLCAALGDPAEAEGTARAVMALCDTCSRLRVRADESDDAVVARVVRLCLLCAGATRPTA